MTKTITLEDLSEESDDVSYPAVVDAFKIEEPVPPQAIKNLKTMGKLGILNADAIMSLVAQAPIDAINLAGTLMQMMPGGWRFSAIDFSMFRVLAQDDKTKQVIAALRVDLLQSDTLMALVRNKANQLVEYKRLVFDGRANRSAELQPFCDDVVAAAKRESGN